jgi:hypothetical protein
MERGVERGMEKEKKAGEKKGVRNWKRWRLEREGLNSFYCVGA